MVTALLAFAPSAFGLDKQGSAHGGQVGGGAKEFNVSGAAMLGASLYNPMYAARPDNTGLALFRYALHLDVDLLGRMLSIPIDINVLTDRERKKALVFAPSELDLIGGLTSTNGLSKGFDLELGARVEARPPRRSRRLHANLRRRARAPVVLGGRFVARARATFRGWRCLRLCHARLVRGESHLRRTPGQ